LTTELFAHSNKKMETAEDLKGIKFRTAGLWAELLEQYGASVITISGAEIYQAAETGIIDAFEYCPPATNWPMGFHEITKYLTVPGIHSPACPNVFLANYDSWNELPNDLQQLLKDEIERHALSLLAMMKYQDAIAMEKYRDYGIEIVTVSPELQQDIARRSREWCDKMAAEDPLFKKVFENQQDFLRTLRAQIEVEPKHSLFD
jgi:TRAP-type mannitol/chloroaromatic compound transport system substrate-binding protein